MPTDIPLDDFALDAIDHALNGALGDGNVTEGADYDLPDLLAFWYGADDDDVPGTYHRDHLIAALVAEVRRLRDTSPAALTGDNP